MKKFWKRLQAILSDNRSGFFSVEDYDQWAESHKQELEEIEKRYNQDLTLEIIAEQFHFHPNSLSRLFKRQTTISFYQYLQKIRLKHAYYD